MKWRFFTMVNHVHKVLVLCPNNYWPLISRKHEACIVNTTVLITLPVIVWKTHKRKLLKTRNRWCKMTEVYNRTKRNVFPDQPAICFHFQQEIPPNLDQHNSHQNIKFSSSVLSYNTPKHTSTLIGSNLWSNEGQTHRWCYH